MKTGQGNFTTHHQMVVLVQLYDKTFSVRDSHTSLAELNCPLALS